MKERARQITEMYREAKEAIEKLHKEQDELLLEVQKLREGENQADLAETVAAITCGLTESLLGEMNKLGQKDSADPDQVWPTTGDYVYHMFSGFPGWWQFMANVGQLAYAVEKEFKGEIEWIEFIDAVVAGVMDAQKKQNWPLRDIEITKIAEDALLNQTVVLTSETPS